MVFGDVFFGRQTLTVTPTDRTNSNVVKTMFRFHSRNRSSVQFKMVSMRSQKPICAPPRLLDNVFQPCLWNGSNFRLIDDGLASLVKRKRVSTLCTTINSPQFGLCAESIYQHDAWKEVFNKSSVPLSFQKAYLHCMYHYQFR